MRSMTGFGRSKNVVNGREYNSEIRSKGNMLPLFNTILLRRFLGEGKSI